jgi:hypothetical protein
MGKIRAALDWWNEPVDMRDALVWSVALSAILIGAISAVGFVFWAYRTFGGT